MNKKPLGDNRKFGNDLTNKSQLNYQKSKEIFDDVEYIDSVNLLDDFQYTKHGENIVYIDEIYEFLKIREKAYYVEENFLHIMQDDVTERMRAILIDWLVEVHLKFKGLPQT